MEILWRGFTLLLKFLSSMKLAVALIASIAVMSVLATLYPEADAFHSWSFRILVGGFFLNLGLCTWNMLPVLWRQMHRTAENLPKEIADNTPRYAVEQAELEAWLQQKHYKVQKHANGDMITILAAKNRAGLCAPHCLHVAILVILVGAMCYSFNVSGFVMGQPGLTRPFPEDLQGEYGENCKVEITDFRTLYDENHAVDNWVTTFSLIIDGKVVAENAETRVNTPYHYKNLMFYQSSYQYRHLLNIAGLENEQSNGDYGLPDNMSTHIDDYAVAVAEINGEMYLQIVDPDGTVRGSKVEPGMELNFNNAGGKITYLDSVAYTVLEVKTQHGSTIILIGFVIAMIASVLFFCGRYRELQIWIPEQKTAYIRCISKNTMAVEELQDELMERWSVQE